MASDDRLLLVRIEANTKKLESQLKRVTNQTVNAARGMDKNFSRANNNVVKGLDRSARRFRTAGRSQGQFRGQIQNTAFQLQDLAVQISGGTAASVAFGQQLPQLLGGLGALGAVIGAIVAVGIPLAKMLLDSGDSAEDLAKQLDELQKAADEYAAAAKRAVVPTIELRQKYGEATEAARTFITALRDIAKVNAFDAVLETLTQLTDVISKTDFSVVGNIESVDKLSAEVDRLLELAQGPTVSVAEALQLSETAEQISSVVLGILDLRSELKTLTDAATVTEDATLAVATALAAVRDAQGPAEQAEATERLLAALQDAIGPYEGLTDEGKALVEQLTRAGEAAAAVAGSGSDAAVTIGNAADAAATLAKNLGIAVSTASRLAILERKGSFPGNLDGSTGTTSTPNAPSDTLPRFELPPNPRRTRTGGGGRRSGGRRSGAPSSDIFASSDRKLQQLEREIEALGRSEHEVAKLTAKYQLLDEAKKQGLDLDKKSARTGQTLREEIERQAEAIGTMTDKLSTARDRFELFKQTTESAKDAIVDLAVTGSADFDSLGDAIKRAAANLILFNRGPLAVGGGFQGILGGLFGGGLKGLIPGFASGTDNAPGGLAIVGERGRELVNLPKGSQVIPNHRIGSAMTNDVNVRVTVDDEGKLSAFVDRRSTINAGQLDQASLRAQRSGFSQQAREFDRRGVS